MHKHPTRCSLTASRRECIFLLTKKTPYKVGDRAVLDLAGFAIGLAQQVARVGLAVQAGGRAVDEHYDYEYAMNHNESQDNAMIISGYIFRAKTPSTH